MKHSISAWAACVREFFGVDTSYERKEVARGLHGRKDGFQRFMDSPSGDFIILKNDSGKLLKVWIASGKEELIPGTFTNIDDGEMFTLNPGTNEFIYQINRNEGKLVMLENVFK